MIWWTLQQLKSSRAETRAEAARKLGQSGEKKAVPALIEALADENSSVRIEAARSLGTFVHPAAVEPLTKAMSRLGRERHTKQERGLESAEYEALAEALGKQGLPAVAPLVQLLQSEDKDLRRGAAIALGHIKSSQAVAPLAERLSDSRSEVRKAAAHALGQIGDPGALVPLKKALGSRDPETRRTVAEALGALGGEGAAEALTAAVEDETETVQLAAIEGLQKIGGLCAGRGLRKAIEAGKRKSICEAAATALKSLKFTAASAGERASAAALIGDFASAVREGEAAAEPLVEALASRDPNRRLQAVEALAAVRTERAVEPLLNALRDYDSKVREVAAGALAGIGLPAFEGLKSSLLSPDAVVQRLAAQALGQIGDARAVGILADTIRSNRGATLANPEPLEAARAAADALQRILTESVSGAAEDDLEQVASVPDGLLEHPEGDSDEHRRPERAVDCSTIRALARQELARRGLSTA